ncbi:MAG: transglycosylase SLT domain-containing protein, partial [Myxococcota bacterium]
ALLDTRNINAPMPTQGGPAAVRVWLYAQARHLLETDQPARAAVLLEMLAPQLPATARHLHLDAALAWARAGQPHIAREHLQQATQGAEGPLPHQPQVTAHIELASGRPLEALQQMLTAEVTGPRIPSEATCSVIADALDRLPPPTGPDDATERALRPLAEPLAVAIGACIRTPVHMRMAASLDALRQRSTPALSLLLDPNAIRSQLARARVYTRDVRNTEAQATLDALLKRTSPEEDAILCEANTMMAITLRRLKKRSQMPPFTRAATRHCTLAVANQAPELRTLRTRALYWGAMDAFKSDPSTAKALFTAILTEAPHTRYGDDALYHLARLAKPKEAAQLRTRLASEYPNGDMLVQLRWEPVQAHLADERWAKAETLLETIVDHPPDASSTTQGRALYWLGRARSKRRSYPQAIQAWKRCFLENPSAFYGHLCAQELMRTTGGMAWLQAQTRPHTATPIPFAITDPVVRDFIDLGDFKRASDHLLSTIPSRPTTDRHTHDLWLAAYLAHLAGDYAHAHSIPRRRIPGFPQRYGMPTTQTRLLWEIAYPDPYHTLVEHWADERNTDPFFVRAIMREESGFAPRIVSWAGAVGLMQIMVPVGKAFGKGMELEIDAEALKRPDINLPIATKILASLGKRFQKHPVFMAAGYNAGPGAARKWRRRHEGEPLGTFADQIPYRGTRGYCRHVTGSYGIYQWLYGQAPLTRWALKVPN